MKTIGIMTFHFADNYGAVLQCYALRKVINSFPQCKAEIINYIPAKFIYSRYSNSTYINDKFKNKREKFEKFLKEECGIKQKVFSYVEGNQYDYYCAGSDQIWTTNAVCDEYFFPHVNRDAVRISYAASLGFGQKDKRLNKEVLKRYLPNFKAISVRENEHVELVKKLSGKSCERVLDPTLLLDEEDYKSIICKERLKEEEFIFFYWLNHDDPIPGIELVNMLSRHYNLPIVHSIYEAPKYMFQRDEGCMFFEGIDNFLWHVKNARFVVTNSYHGTIFSILFKRPFYTFVVKSMRSRIDTLMGIIDIKKRIVESYVGVDQIDEDIAFEMIDKKIKQERKKSLDFLKRALDINV